MARPLYTHKVFKDRQKKWRWTLFARNGRKVATCGEGYNRRGHAEAMVFKLFGAALALALFVVAR